MPFLTIIASNELKNILVLVGSHINFNSMQNALKWIQLITISYIFLLDIKQMPTLYVMEKLLLNYLILNVNLAIRKALGMCNLKLFK